MRLRIVPFAFLLVTVAAIQEDAAAPGSMLSGLKALDFALTDYLRSAPVAGGPERQNCCSGFLGHLVSTLP
jgi:hypothetical protein